MPYKCFEIQYFIITQIILHYLNKKILKNKVIYLFKIIIKIGKTNPLFEIFYYFFSNYFKLNFKNQDFPIPFYD
jgi:hypothetical protein